MMPGLKDRFSAIELWILEEAAGFELATRLRCNCFQDNRFKPLTQTSMRLSGFNQTHLSAATP